jgi:Icc-related predicted phosphoesterase
MKKHLTSKIFFGLSITFFTFAFLFLFAHTYFSDYWFKTIHNYHNPASEFIAKDKSETSILLVSDTGSKNLVLRKILKQADTSKYDFVMYLGDLQVNASVTGYYWLLNDIKPFLGDTPFYTIPGNHDVTRRIGLTRKHFKDKSFYETVMGQRYYWFGYGNTLFITLDSSDETLDDQQLVWLDDTLKKIRPLFKNCIIFGHVPPANSCLQCFEDHITKPISTQKFANIIKKYKINAMFFGHVHFYSHAKFENIDFYTTPSSGQSVRDPKNRKFGYISVKINKNGKIDVQPGFIDFHGKKQDSFKEWASRDLLGPKVRMSVSTALRLSLLILILAMFLRSYEKHK